MNDKAFLGYVELHARTERHAFSFSDVERLMDLAGVEILPLSGYSQGGFVGIDQHEADRLVKRARARLVG